MSVNTVSYLIICHIVRCLRRFHESPQVYVVSVNTVSYLIICHIVRCLRWFHESPQVYIASVNTVSILLFVILSDVSDGFMSLLRFI